MEAQARALGARYLQVLQPHLYVEGSKPMSEQEREEFYQPDWQESRDAAAGYPYLVEAGRLLVERGIPLLDLSMVFRDIDETIYSDACCHYNDRGYAIVAEAIAEAIATL